MNTRDHRLEPFFHQTKKLESSFLCLRPSARYCRNKSKIVNIETLDGVLEDIHVF